MSAPPNRRRGAPERSKADRSPAPRPKPAIEAGGLRQRGAVWIVGLLAVAVYANTFTAAFTLDDMPLIVENRLVTSLENLPLIFTTNYWGESEKHSSKYVYRPLAVASYALNYSIHGLRPAGYHVANVLLHAAVSVLLLVLVRNLLKQPQVAFVAALLFAVHPIHTEAVSGVVGRAEIMALFGILLCCWGAERASRAHATYPWGWVAVSVIGYWAGMLSKEIGVIAPALIILWEILLPERRWLLRGDRRAMLVFGCYGLALTIYWVMRSNAVHALGMNIGFVGATQLERVWTALRVCLEYVGLLLLPIRLSAEYWVTDVPLARSPWEPGTAAAILLLAGAGLLVVRAWRRWPGVCWGMGFFVIGLLPVSNLLFPIGVMKAERVLYTPSAGFLVALAGLLTPLLTRPRLRPLGWTLVGLVAVLCSIRTWVRNDDWKDNHALAAATLKTSPNSPTFHLILARWYSDQRLNEPAREHLLIALQQRPGHVGTLYNLGNLELGERQYDQAIRYYQQALREQPHQVRILNNLGMAFQGSGRLVEAAETFNQARLLRPDDPGAYVNLISTYGRLQDAKAALAIAEEASRRFPKHAGVLWNLGAVYKMLGREKEASEAFGRAAELDPGIRGRSSTRAIFD